MGSFGVNKNQSGLKVCVTGLKVSQIRSKYDQKGSNLTQMAQSGIKVGLSWVNRCTCDWGLSNSNS